MKLYIPILAVGAIIAAAAISCKREYTVAVPVSGTSGSAFVKIVHASPNFAKIFGSPDNLSVYIGSTKVNATALKFNTTYPTTGYAAIAAGQQTIRISEAGVMNPDSITLVSLQRNIVAGNYYTLIITDSIKNGSRDTARVWINDYYPKPSAGPGYSYLRFAHTVFTDTIGDSVDLYSTRRNLTIFTRIKMDSMTPFTALPTLLGVTDTLYVRRKGTTNVLAKVLPVNMGDQQYYTAYFIGDTVSTGTKVKTLVFSQNR